MSTVPQYWRLLTSRGPLLGASSYKRAFLQTAAVYVAIFLVAAPLHHWTVRYQDAVELLKVMAAINFYFVQTYGYLWFTVVYLSMSFLYVDATTGKTPIHDIQRIFGSFAVLTALYVANTIWFFGSSIFERVDIAAGAYCDGAKSKAKGIGIGRTACETSHGRWVSHFDVSGHCYLLLCITLLTVCELLGNFCATYSRSSSFKRRPCVCHQSITNHNTDFECDGCLNEQPTARISVLRSQIKNTDSAQQGTFQTSLLQPGTSSSVHAPLIDSLSSSSSLPLPLPSLTLSPRPIALIALSLGRAVVVVSSLVLVILWLAMYTTTNLFFHTAAERLCGLVVGVVAASIAAASGSRFSLQDASRRHNCRNTSPET